jgi:hypothetical protein
MYFVDSSFAIVKLKSDVILTLVLDMAFVKMTPVENHLPVLAAIPGQDMHVIYVTFAYQILVYIMEHVKMVLMGLHHVEYKCQYDIRFQFHNGDHSNRVDRYTGNYCCLKCIFPYSGMDENGTYLLFDSASKRELHTGQNRGNMCM